MTDDHGGPFYGISILSVFSQSLTGHSREHSVRERTTMGVTRWNFEHYESINWATARMVEAKEGEYIKWTDHKAALAERDRIIAKACKSLHDSSRAML